MKTLEELIETRRGLSSMSVFASPRGGFEANIVDARSPSGFFIGLGKTPVQALREALTLKETNSVRRKIARVEDDV